MTDPNEEEAQEQLVPDQIVVGKDGGKPVIALDEEDSEDESGEEDDGSTAPKEEEEDQSPPTSPSRWHMTGKRLLKTGPCDMISCNHPHCTLSDQCAASPTCNSLMHYECITDDQGQPSLRDVHGPEGVVHCSSRCK